MNYDERCDVIDRLEQRHEQLIEQLDELNLRIENVLVNRPPAENEA